MTSVLKRTYLAVTVSLLALLLGTSPLFAENKIVRAVYKGGQVMELFDETGRVYKTIPLPYEEYVERESEGRLIDALYERTGDLERTGFTSSPSLISRAVTAVVDAELEEDDLPPKQEKVSLWDRFKTGVADLLKRGEGGDSTEILETTKITSVRNNPKTGEGLISGNIDTVGLLTREITELAARRKVSLSSVGESPIDPLIVSLVAERKEKLLLLAKKNPEAFFSFVLPAETRRLMPQSLQKDIEEEQTVTGTLEVIHVDDFEHHEHSHHLYFLHVTSRSASRGGGRIALKSTIPSAGERIQLFPLEDIEAVSGTVLRVKGYRIENVMVPRPGRASLQSLQTPPPESVGEQKMLAVIVDMKGQTSPLAVGEAKRALFADDAPFQRFFKEQSYGKAWFTGDVYRITLDRAPKEGDCGSGVRLRDTDVIAALKEQRVDLGMYDRVLFIPPVGYCSGVGKNSFGPTVVNDRSYQLSESWVGWGAVQSGLTRDSLNSTLAHEIGHALGVWHANFWNCRSSTLHGDCLANEYGNLFDMMGRSAFSLHFNALYKDILGWFDPSRVRTVRESDTVELSPLESDTGVALVKIPDPFTNETFLGLEYREALGFDSVLAQGAGKVNLHGVLVNAFLPRYLGLSRGTYLLDMRPKDPSYSLQQGVTFLDPDTGIELRNASLNTKTISLGINLQKPRCTPRHPRVNVASELMRVTSGKQHGFSVSLYSMDAPACEEGRITLEASLPQGWRISDFNVHDLESGSVSKSEESTILLPPRKKVYVSFLMDIPEATPTGARSLELRFVREGAEGAPPSKILALDVVRPPTIRSIQPQPVSIGTEFQIMGTGFLAKNKTGITARSPKWGWFTALFEDVPATASNGEMVLRAVMPKRFCLNRVDANCVDGVDAADDWSYFLFIRNEHGVSNEVSFKARTIRTPVIESVAPTSATLGQTIHLVGKNFASNDIVEGRHVQTPSSVFLYTVRPEHITSRSGGEQDIALTIPYKNAGNVPLEGGRYTLTGFNFLDGTESKKASINIVSASTTEPSHSSVRVSRADVASLLMPRELRIGEGFQALGSFAVSASEPVRIDTLTFRLAATGNPSALSGMSNFELWGINPSFRAGLGQLSSGKDSIVFRSDLQVKAGTTMYSIYASPGTRFTPGQTLRLSADFWKDDVTASTLKEPKRTLSFPKGEVSINTLTAKHAPANPQPALSGSSTGTNTEQNLDPAHVGINLISSPLSIEGGTPSGDGTYAESAVVLRGTVHRTGRDRADAFKSVIQFMPAGGVFSDLVSLEVPTLGAADAAEISYSFDIKSGGWSFRLCADNLNVVVETNEGDNCSEPLRIEVRGSGTARTESTGTPNLTLSVPLWIGTSAGGGRLKAGDMSLSVKIRNVGDRISKPVKGLWQYAVATGQFNDWVDVEFPPIEPDASTESSYSWKGGSGLWRARFCLLESSASDGRLCSGAVAVEIIE